MQCICRSRYTPVIVVHVLFIMEYLYRFNQLLMKCLSSKYNAYQNMAPRVPSLCEYLPVRMRGRTREMIRTRIALSADTHKCLLHRNWKEWKKSVKTLSKGRIVNIIKLCFTS